MATYVATNHRAYVAHLDATDSATLSFGPLVAAAVPFPSFADGGYLSHKPGLKSGAMSVEKYQDFAVDAWDEEISGLGLGAQFPVSAMPNTSGTETAGDPAWFTRGILTAYNPLMGAVGEAAKGPISMVYDTVILRGVVSHPKAARTVTGNGTIIAFTGPTATQRLYSALHVHAYSGITNLVVTVQSDDGVGFGTPVTRLTHATVTGTTSEFLSVAGYGATETHHRVVYTITGAGSVTFTSFIAVL